MRFSHPLVTNALLLGILFVLALIWWRMPATYGDMKSAKTPEARKSIRNRQQMVYIHDTVDVQVVNDPLDVEINK